MVGALTSWSIIGLMQESMPGMPGWLILIDRAAHRLRRRRHAQLRDREGGLPAAAQQSQAGAADHRDRHVDPAADAGDDHLEADQQGLSEPAADQPIHRRRRGDLADAGDDPGGHRDLPGDPDLAGQLHQAGPRDARHRREPARGGADGHPARHGDLGHLHHRRRAGGDRRRDVRLQLRHRAARDGLHARPQGLHGGRVRRHRQPRRRGGGRHPARADRSHRLGLPRCAHGRRAGQPATATSSPSSC